MSAGPALGGIQAILLDIEGTTTPIAFVFDVLFPYARRHLRSHLAQHATAPGYDLLFDRLHGEHVADRRTGENVPPWIDAPLTARLASVATYCEWLMDRDRKSTSLKELQGKIWEEGYGRGELVGEVFDDVATALQRWRAQHLRVGIFSSGSTLAQHLLFGHSSAGDLTTFLQSHFDTAIGSKTDSESYRRIAAEMEVPPEAILFISDVTAELDAALRAGMQTMLSMRPGNKLTAHTGGHPVIRRLDELV